MPGFLYLNAFADVVSDYFGVVAYHVGSSAAFKDEPGATFRDVDIRVMLPDDRYNAEGYEHIGGAPIGTKWSAICLAFSALGEKMTGLPIDFQVQSVTDGNRQSGPRWACGLRFAGVTHSRRAAGHRVPYADVDDFAAIEEATTPALEAAPRSPETPVAYSDDEAMMRGLTGEPIDVARLSTIGLREAEDDAAEEARRFVGVRASWWLDGAKWALNRWRGASQDTRG